MVLELSTPNDVKLISDIPLPIEHLPSLELDRVETGHGLVEVVVLEKGVVNQTTPQLPGHLELHQDPSFRHV